MTLIARMRFGAAPLYIGDAMLSNPGKPLGNSRSLPAYVDVNASLPEGAWGYVSGLRQKVNLLNGGDLVLAWAGNELQARLALRELEQAAKEGAASTQDFFEIIDAKPTNELDQLTLLGTKVTPIPGMPSRVSSFAVNCPFQESISGVDCRVAGSGTDRFHFLLPSILQGEVLGASDDQQILRAWRVAATAAGLLIGEEAYRGTNIAEMWGGAFEAAHVSNNRIEKIGNALHSVWWLERLNDKQAELRMWLKLLKYDYIDDHLFVNVVEFAEQGATGDTHIISPLLRRNEAPAFVAPTFSHDHLLCHVSLLPDAAGFVRTYTMSRFRQETMIEVDFGAEKTQILVSESLFEAIRIAVQPHSEYEIVL